MVPSWSDLPVYLNENLVDKEKLPTYVRGVFSCTGTTKLTYVPHSVTNKSLGSRICRVQCCQGFNVFAAWPLQYSWLLPLARVLWCTWRRLKDCLCSLGSWWVWCQTWKLLSAVGYEKYSTNNDTLGRASLKRYTQQTMMNKTQWGNELHDFIHTYIIL